MVTPGSDARPPLEIRLVRIPVFTCQFKNSMLSRP